MYCDGNIIDVEGIIYDDDFEQDEHDDDDPQDEFEFEFG